MSHAHPSLTPDEQRIVDQFHTLYYTRKLWNTTTWLGVPCLKCPFDMWVYQEILHETRPELIVETGTAWGGSALFLAGVLDALGQGRIITIDTESRRNEASHPRMEKIKASSLDPGTIARVRDAAAGKRTMLILDSLHNRDHVLRELLAYAGLVSPGCYAIVEDSDINGHPVHTDFAPDQGPGPFEAVEEFLASNPHFSCDRSREKLLMTLNPRGYLRRDR